MCARLKYLSPWEFNRYCLFVPLSPPPGKRDQAASSDGWQNAVDATAARTKWVVEDAHGDAHRSPPFRPGIDYVVREPGRADTYMTFQDIPGEPALRHQWVVELRRVPVVPVFMKSPLPSWRMDRERRGELLSAYYRPWTL